MKAAALTACLTQAGRINGLAIDQGRSLDAAIQAARDGEARPDDAMAFKTTIVAMLGDAASVTLVDSAYGPGISRSVQIARPLMFGYEQDIYRKDGTLLVPELPPDWSALRLVELGARAVKLFLYFDPDATDTVSEHRKVVVERVGAECVTAGVPFFLEPITGSPDPRTRPAQVRQAVEEFSKDRYHVDVLKIEIPIEPQHIPALYSHAQAVALTQEISASTSLPHIFLSGGVPFDRLVECLEFAGQAQSGFSGVLCGRSVWHDGIPVFARQGEAGLREWLDGEGRRRLRKLEQLVAAHGNAVPVTPGRAHD